MSKQIVEEVIQELDGLTREPGFNLLAATIALGMAIGWNVAAGITSKVVRINHPAWNVAEVVIAFAGCWKGGGIAERYTPKLAKKDKDDEEKESGDSHEAD